MGWTSNENVALTSVAERDGLHIVYETGLVMKREEPYFACSPDGVALMDLNGIESTSEWVSSITVT